MNNKLSLNKILKYNCNYKIYRLHDTAISNDRLSVIRKTTAINMSIQQITDQESKTIGIQCLRPLCTNNS